MVAYESIVCNRKRPSLIFNILGNKKKKKKKNMKYKNLSGLRGVRPYFKRYSFARHSQKCDPHHPKNKIKTQKNKAINFSMW